MLRRGLGSNVQRERTFPRALTQLALVVIHASKESRAGTQKGRSLLAPTMWAVKALDEGEYLAITHLLSCTGLAVYDPHSKVCGMYHFGGQFSKEEDTLDAFFLKLIQKGARCDRVNISLSGSKKCGYAAKLLNYLKTVQGIADHQFAVYESEQTADTGAEFYLFGDGRVAHVVG